MISSKRTIKSLTALFVAMAFMFVGNMLVVSSVGVILKQNGTSTLAIGIVNAFFFLGAAFSTISAHRIIVQIGHIRAFGIYISLFAMGTILHNISANLWLWIVLRFALGVAYYGILMILESWINEKAKNAVRSRVISVYEIVSYMSFGVGILLMGLDIYPSCDFDAICTTATKSLANQ